MQLHLDGLLFGELEFEILSKDLQLVGHLMGADFIAGVEVHVLNVGTDVKVPGSGDTAQAMNWLIGFDGAY